MNTGIRDAVNLGWTISGVLKGCFTDSVLETYSLERRAVVEQLIALGKTVSTLIPGRLPPGYRGDAYKVHGDVLESSAQFTIGLGVHYEANIINKDSSVSAVEPRCRAPDVLVDRPGSKIPMRLHQVTKNHGRFWIVVFAGSPFRTRSKLKVLREHPDGSQIFTSRLMEAFTFITVIAGHGLRVDEVLGLERFGDAFYNLDESAHVRYGIAVDEGAVLILRPDGILGFAAYLESFITRKS